MTADTPGPAAPPERGAGEPNLATRLPTEEVIRQRSLLGEPDGRLAPLDGLPHPVFLTNRYRQIVYANAAVAALLPDRTVEAVIGLRPGEAVGCVHSSETAGGCGTTEFCTTCGTARALRMAARGERACDECRIVSGRLGRDLDLRVWATPFPAGGEIFTLFTVLDIRDEKRREALEQVFFHDVLNTASGIEGIARLCGEATPDEREEMGAIVLRLARVLVDELKAQQALAAMERGDLVVRAEALSSLDVLRAAAEAFAANWAARGRALQVRADAADVAFTSDGTLLRRVIGNMIKNALEACPSGGTVTVGCRRTGDRLAFTVHSPAVMPRDVQLQVFQRSFSTKGPGRGLGTYSMKLLSEQYLGGRVGFTSAAGAGTTFTATYGITLPVGG